MDKTEWLADVSLKIKNAILKEIHNIGGLAFTCPLMFDVASSIQDPLRDYMKTYNREVWDKFTGL